MNKEIKEILNYMKQYVENVYEHDSEPMLNYKDLQIVLSYIEQLENNRDKAIEILYKRKHVENLFGGVENSNTDKIINILKGDSDD